MTEMAFNDLNYSYPTLITWFTSNITLLVSNLVEITKKKTAEFGENFIRS